LLEKPLSNDFCQSELTDGNGTQTRVVPWGLTISTRVVTSKVRQTPGTGENWGVALAAAACAKLIAGKAVDTRATAEFFKKRRRSALLRPVGTVVIKRTPGGVEKQAQSA
jgi:hypothetical protein